MLGIARRSGNVSFGFEQVSQMMGKGKLKLVIISEDTAERTAKKIMQICQETRTPWIIYGDKEELSQAIGQYNKTVFGVKDKNIAKQLLVYYNELKNE